jgi:hypothetical protein
MVIFFLWVIFFSMQLYILKSNYNTADETPGAPVWLGYVIITF